MKDVCVIVCHHQGNLILKCVHSILKSRGVNLRLIVATSKKDLSLYGARCLYIPGSPAKKRNIALRFCEEDYIAYFDDDVEVEPDAIYRMLEVLKKRDVGMVFGKTKNMEFRNRLDGAGSFLTSTGFLFAREESGCEDVGQFERVESVLAGKSASCMIRRSAISEAGFFDEAYGILGEETDLAWRVWLKGMKVLFVPKSVTYHAFNTRFKPKDFYTHERVYFNGSRNYLAMLTTNLEGKNLWRIIPVHFLMWVVAGLTQLVSLRIRASWNIFKGLHYYLTHLKPTLEKRKLIQESRVPTDEELFRIIKYDPPWSYYLTRLVRYIKVGLHG